MPTLSKLVCWEGWNPLFWKVRFLPRDLADAEYGTALLIYIPDILFPLPSSYSCSTVVCYVLPLSIFPFPSPFLNLLAFGSYQLSLAFLSRPNEGFIEPVSVLPCN